MSSSNTAIVKEALVKSRVVDDLLTADATKVLSANQGVVIKSLIDSINALLTSDDVTLDEMQELVTFIKQNKSTLDALAIANIAGLVDALALKSDTTHDHAGTYEPADATILKDADLDVNVQAYDVNTAKTDVPQTFTAPQRNSTTAEDNIIDYTASNNFSLTAIADVMGTPIVAGCSDQTGIITIHSAENITGWDNLYQFKNIPTDLSGAERFAYHIESETSIAIGRMQ